MSLPGINLQNIIQPLLETKKQDVASLLKLLRVGQVLPARVISMTSPNTARLQMVGTQLQAQTNTMLKPGQDLQLQVVKTGAKPQLQIQQIAVPVNKPFVLLKNALPKQMAPAEVQQGLKQALTLTQQAKPSVALPAATISSGAAALKQLVSVINDKAVPLPNLNAPKLKTALQSSGIFMEATLAKGQVPAQDGKADMLRLLSQWMPLLKQQITVKTRPTPQGEVQVEGNKQLPAASLLERLTRLLEGSVTRVQSHQAAALQSEDGNRQIWQFELPIRLHEQLDHPLIQIEKENKQNEQGMQTNWNVNLAFEFDTLGKVQCRILLQQETVSATFWCEQPETVQKFSDKLPTLEAALRGVGLEIGQMASVPGKPPHDFTAIPLDRALFDEHV